MNNYKKITKEEQLIYMIEFYKNYLLKIKTILEELEKELDEEKQLKKKG